MKMSECLSLHFWPYLAWLSTKVFILKWHFSFFCVLFSTAAVLSVFGNGVVLVRAAGRFALLKSPELLTVNLALTDIGMALSMYPLSIYSCFNHAWIGGDRSCLYYGLMGMIFSITSIMTLAVMGMIRFMVAGSPPKTGDVFSHGVNSKTRAVFNENQLRLAGSLPIPSHLRSGLNISRHMYLEISTARGHGAKVVDFAHCEPKKHIRITI